jgi:CBS domain-containing protein
MKLKEIMTAEVLTISPSASLKDAAKKMLKEDVGSLPVCDDDQIVGIVTDRDIAIRGVAQGLDPEHAQVREVMTAEVCACSSESDIEAACELMERKQIRRLLVVDENDSAVGLVSLGDLALRLKENASGEVLKAVSHP